MTQNVLITGVSPYIGMNTAKILLDKTYMYAVARRQEKMENLKALSADLIYLYLNVDARLTEAIDQIIEGQKRIGLIARKNNMKSAISMNARLSKSF